MVVQTVLLIIVKVLIAKNFKKINIVDMVVHALENCNIPGPWQEWDSTNGSVSEHREAHRQVTK
jgi:hypothetical protein